MSAVPSPGSGYSEEETVEWRHFSEQGLVPLHLWQSRHNYVKKIGSVVVKVALPSSFRVQRQNGVLGAVSVRDPEEVVVFLRKDSWATCLDNNPGLHLNSGLPNRL